MLKITGLGWCLIEILHYWFSPTYWSYICAKLKQAFKNESFYHKMFPTSSQCSSTLKKVDTFPVHACSV